MPRSPLQRVLYVDDDEVVQHLVQLSLERIGGLTVKLVNESTAAIESIRSFEPDLLILDCIMPGIDGETLYRRIRELPEFAGLPVVFLTVKAHWRTIEDLMALGAAGVITKPFAAKTLADQLKAIWAGLPGPGDPAV